MNNSRDIHECHQCTNEVPLGDWLCPECTELLKSNPFQPILLEWDTYKYPVGKGWQGLCKDVFKEIADVYRKNLIPLELFYAMQIKEKFGVLRIYTNDIPEQVYYAVQEIIENAEDKSATICEECGQPGELRSDGWLTTLCDEHAAQVRRVSW